MINISRRHPWMLWTDSICPAFSNNPAADTISGANDYVVTLDFEYNNNVGGVRKELFAIVPFYTGVSVVNNEIFVGIGYESGDVFLPTGYLLEPNTKFRLKLEHTSKQVLKLSIYDKEVVRYDLTNDPLKINTVPQMFVGSGLWPEGQEEDVEDLTFYELQIHSKKELVAHHKFEKFIHSKSIDLTGNCNFLFKLR